MSDNNITVVVPTYNRAHLIDKTVPTYLQNQRVKELILINDCSTDNTIEIIKKVQLKYPQVKLLNLKRNFKQAVAKNYGIKATNTDFIYFGDDDSFMLPNAIDHLYDSLIKYGADIAAARALYLDDVDDLSNLQKFVNEYDQLKGELFRFEKLEFNFYLRQNSIVEVPMSQACILIRSKDALKIKFDENYIGNGFREETDFTLRATASGLKLIYDSSVIQFNYPRKIATGGASNISKWEYFYSMVKNNWYFLSKNKTLIKEHLNINKSIYILQLIMWKKILMQLIMGVSRRIFHK